MATKLQKALHARHSAEWSILEIVSPEDILRYIRYRNLREKQLGNRFDVADTAEMNFLRAWWLGVAVSKLR